MIKEENIEAFAGRIAREIMDDLSDRSGYGRIKDDDEADDHEITLAWEKIVIDALGEYRESEGPILTGPFITIEGQTHQYNGVPSEGLQFKIS